MLHISAWYQFTYKTETVFYVTHFSLILFRFWVRLWVRQSIFIITSIGKNHILLTYWRTLRRKMICRLHFLLSNSNLSWLHNDMMVYELSEDMHRGYAGCACNKEVNVKWQYQELKESNSLSHSRFHEGTQQSIKKRTDYTTSGHRQANSYFPVMCPHLTSNKPTKISQRSIKANKTNTVSSMFQINLRLAWVLWII